VSAELVVLFEDEHLAVVEKPPGMHTAPLRGGETGTLLERVLGRYPEVAALPGIRPMEPGLLHRLDRETSGLVVVARTPAAFARLREAFESGAAHKEYTACSSPGALAPGASAPSEAVVTSRFASLGPGRKMVRVVLPGETRRRALREATDVQYSTRLRVLRRAAAAVLVSARLDRGFRHQVRAHLAHVGLPIIGDPLYGAPLPPGAAPRMYLHATRIELPHPVTGALLAVVSPLPPEFAALLSLG
jgi:23S rRNA pseudouridine1911/1915/1917 synthase